MFGLTSESTTYSTLLDSDRFDADLVSLLVHPYARYGYGVALHQAKTSSGELNDQELRSALISSIKEGLNHFRMETDDSADGDTVYRAINTERLNDNPNLVQGKLAITGKFLFPTVVTTDGGARDTYDSVAAIMKELESLKPFRENYDFKRSFAPSVSKINNGSASQRVPRGTLLEAACAAIATVTPLKPAAWIGKLNTAIIPDLPTIEGIVDFIEIFRALQVHEGAEKQALISKKPQDAQSDKPKPERRQTKTEDPAVSIYRRPPIFRGNYPFAPYDAEYFGAAGVLAAIGYWSNTAEKTHWANSVLESLIRRPIYVVSYDDIRQCQFSHQTIRMAKNGTLRPLIKALSNDTLIGGAEMESGRRDLDASNRKLFKIMAGRFLQQFSEPTFQDFFAFRATYPSELAPLFKEYFMDIEIEPAELSKIVQSASEYGAWLNKTAYRAAKDAFEEGADPTKIVKQKAKIITVLESTAMSAKTSGALISLVSTQACRLVPTEAPFGSKRFINAVLTGEISLIKGRQLLMAYLRLQPQYDRKPKTTEADEQYIDESPVSIEGELS